MIVIIRLTDHRFDCKLRLRSTKSLGRVKAARPENKETEA
jgi:hypothetical protein